MKTDKLVKLALRVFSASLVMMVASTASARWEVNMPKGVTDISNEVYGLHMLIFWICVAIAVVVFGAMIVSIFAHRKSKGITPATFSHNTKVEIVWTIIPFLILIGMAIPAAETLIKMEDTRNPDLTIKVTGYQWKWHYEYLDEDFGFFSTLAKPSNEARRKRSGIDPTSVDHYLRDVDNPVVVPVGAKVRILLTANDVIHAWWVPDLAVKKDAIPGFITETWFKIDEPGTYRGQCAELCGRDHGFMPVVVEAVSQTAYASWVETQRAESVASAADSERNLSFDELMAQGKTTYNTHCAGCHQADGTGITPMFPSLTDSGVVRGPVADHVDVVVNGRPGTAMEAFGPQLSDFDIAAVVTYVRNAWDSENREIVQPTEIIAAR